MTSSEARARLSELAALRITVFKEFPYIYDGSLDYEVKYLGRYLDSKTAMIFVAETEKVELVGMSTCQHMNDEMEEVKKPFITAGISTDSIFYFGESLLQPQFRGQGIGKKFFELRENYARSFPKIETTTFCAVDRPSTHPQRPSDYQPLDLFWNSRGYLKKENLKCYLQWQDMNESVETVKSLSFWVKQWPV